MSAGMGAGMGDLVATLLTDRPDVFQARVWAERDGAPYRARIVAVGGPGAASAWAGAELLVVDVVSYVGLELAYGARRGVTLAIGWGDLDQCRAAKLFRRGVIGGFGRMDDFDSRSALLAILDGYRSGPRAELLAVLARA
jgi:hypothetical protein